MSTLVFKVQADRIQSDDETLSTWIGVKISAAFDTLPPADPDRELLDALLPWKWKALTPPAPPLPHPVWSPHSRDSWAVWKIDEMGAVTAVDAGRISNISVLVPRPELIEQLNKAIDGIAIGGDKKIRPESLCFDPPLEETKLAGTVPGFVERLATLPHPVPCASYVHALLQIDLEAGESFEKTRFIAAPSLTTDAFGAFDPAGPHDTNLDGVWETTLVKDCKAEMVPSLTKADLVANPAQGRIIDLFDQGIAVLGGEGAHRKTLPTAEAVAELPQRLADAMDPLARIRSVLERASAAWLQDDTVDQTERDKRRAALEGDFKQPPAGGAAPLRLKIALDKIAIQVLGQRFDLVGRFENPLLAALQAEDTAKAQKLLEDQLKRLPLVPVAPGEHVNAAFRVEESEITSLNHNGKPVKLADVSPFTEGYLKKAAGIDQSGDPAEPLDEKEILRKLWMALGPVSPSPTPTEGPGLRYHELTAPPSGEKNLQVMREHRSAPPSLGGAPEPGDAEAFARTSFDRARASMALAYAAPFIESLVAGVTNWHDPLNPGLPKPEDALFERLRDSMKALLWQGGGGPGLYRTLLDLTIPSPPVPPDDPIRNLLEKILEMAAAEAVRITTRLAFRTDRFDRITPLPLPLALQIDQLRTFSRKIDVWTRLSGYGLLAARKGHVGDENKHSTPFVSLNPATLYIGGLSAPGPVDRDGNPRAIEGVAIEGAYGEGNTKSRNFVDPLPYAPGDQVGVSDAVAEFANSWATAPMPGHQLVDQPGALQGVAAARIVAGPPPVPPAPAPPPAPPPDRRSQIDLLPTLSFGRAYHVIGHLVAQGGVLAPFLRHPDNPYVFADTFDEARFPPRARLDNYVRTTGIGAPAITHDAVPPPVPIELLANELPKRLPAAGLPAEGLRINYDHETGGTLIDWPEGNAPGLRFEFVTGSTTNDRFKLQLADPEKNLGEIELPLLPAPDVGRWWRVDVAKGGGVRLRFKDIAATAEEELRGEFFKDGWQDHAGGGLLPSASDEGVYITLRGASSVMVEPVRVVPIVDTNLAGQATEVPALTGPRSAKTKASEPVLLDGLDVGAAAVRKSNGMVRNTVNVKVTGPSIDRHTWERWTNCALFSLKGDPQREWVAGMLAKLQKKPAPAQGRGAEEELPDPAVTALWVELWQVFPERKRVTDPILRLAADTKKAPMIDVGLTAADGEAVEDPTATKIEYKVRRGRIYELRVRAAIDPDAKPFDDLRPNGARIGRAVLESCTTGVDPDDKPWLLGPVSILTVEVATSELPGIAKPEKLDLILRPHPRPGPGKIDLVLPPALLGNEVRRTLRYCASAGLIPQKWSWRGLPRPLTPDEAFEERKDDQVGRFASGPLRAAHALALTAATPPTHDQLPAVLTRDLDWRGGWNLWRFRVRLTSRYAPLFFREADSGLDLPDKAWVPHRVEDADNGRAVTKPPLMLVLPLTETDDDPRTSVPPLLALFSGPMHVNDHFGDMLAVAVETARHPLPWFRLTVPPPDDIGDPPSLKNLKFLPEVGPDPIRTGAAHSGAAVPLRLEGAIGYGFDRGDAARFNHSGFIVTPLTRDIAPWSMIKLKFRREEDPAGLLDSGSLEPGKPIQISGIWPGKPGLRHEGVAFDLRVKGGDRIRIAMHEDSPTDKKGQQVVIKTELVDGRLKVGAWVLKAGDSENTDSDWAKANEPNAGWATWDLGFGRAELRLVVSARPKPGEVRVWRPAGEVAVKLRIVQDGPSPDGWLSLFSLPLEASRSDMPIEQEAKVTIEGDQLDAKPVRLSEYASSVWCQFTVPSSNFRISGSTSETSPITGLRLAKSGSGGWDKIELRDSGGKACKLEPDTPATRGSSEASVSEVRWAVLTEPSFDSLGRERERPYAVVPLETAGNVTVCGRPIWPRTDIMPPAGSGRWRIMRVLVRSNTTVERLEELFDEPLGSVGAGSAEPEDAKAVVLSVSRPATWAFN